MCNIACDIVASVKLGAINGAHPFIIPMEGAGLPALLDPADPSFLLIFVSAILVVNFLVPPSLSLTCLVQKTSSSHF